MPQSLDLLSLLAWEANDTVEFIMHGRSSSFTYRAIAALPYVQYGDPYDNHGDLRRAYGDAHFSWAIDYYESGKNSACLPPNQIYDEELITSQS